MRNMDEKQRRQFLYIESTLYGKYGKHYIASIFHISLHTLEKAQREFDKNLLWSKDNELRIHDDLKKNIKRHKLITLYRIIEGIIQNETYGDPMTSRRWVNMSLRRIKDILEKEYNIQTNIHVIQFLLKTFKYSLQANKKYLQVGEESPYRDEQFKFIAEKTLDFLKAGEPVISVDTKAIEYLGNYTRKGRILRKVNDPLLTSDHDFKDNNNKAIPHGIYVLNKNQGFCTLGVSHDTAEFARNSIYWWWKEYGCKDFPKAKKLYILCDGGGSNKPGPLWKSQIALLSMLMGVEIHVSHYPPGCSKFNKIEHLYFSFISINWQGIPLESLEMCKNFIDNTTTSKGLISKCRIDYGDYPLNNKIFTNDEYEDINIIECEILGKLNYIIDES